MRKHYDFSNAKRNRYARRLKQQVMIRIDRDTIGYFKRLADETGIRYQTLINSYLRGCALTGKRLSNTWTAGGRIISARKANRKETRQYEEIEG